MKTVLKKYYKPALLLAAVLLIFWLASGFTRQSETEEPALKTVAVETVGIASEGEGVTLSGNVIPVETVKLSFKVPGLISGVLVSEGDMVADGQLIAVLDQSDYSIQERAAMAQWQSAKMQIDSEIPAKVNQAEAQLNLTQATYDRVKELYGEGAASKSQLDEVEAKLTVDQNTYRQAKEAMEIALTELGMAEAAYDQAATQIQDTALKSSIGGVVLQKVLEAGEVTSAGYPVVAVGKIDQVWVEIGVPDHLINQLTSGDEAEVYIYGLEETLRGTVDEIGFLADSTTRTFPVKVRVDNPQHTLRPGMIARVSFASGSETGKICVPATSVIQLADRSVVFLLTEDGSTVRKTEVVTGEMFGDKIEILSGVAVGDRLVTEGQFKLRDGETVVLKNGAGFSSAVGTEGGGEPQTSVDRNETDNLKEGDGI